MQDPNQFWFVNFTLDLYCIRHFLTVILNILIQRDIAVICLQHIKLLIRLSIYILPDKWAYYVSSHCILGLFKLNWILRYWRLSHFSYIMSFYSRSNELSILFHLFNLIWIYIHLFINGYILSFFLAKIDDTFIFKYWWDSSSREKTNYIIYNKIAYLYAIWLGDITNKNCVIAY